MAFDPMKSQSRERLSCRYALIKEPRTILCWVTTPPPLPPSFGSKSSLWERLIIVAGGILKPSSCSRSIDNSSYCSGHGKLHIQSHHPAVGTGNTSALQGMLSLLLPLSPNTGHASKSTPCLLSYTGKGIGIIMFQSRFSCIMEGLLAEGGGGGASLACIS